MYDAHTKTSIKFQVYGSVSLQVSYHHYKNGVQFISLNHYGTLKVKKIHCILVISPWLKLFHYDIIM